MYAIIKGRNKLNSKAQFSLGDILPFFAHSIITNLIKMQIPLDRIADSFLRYVKFVSRHRSLRFLCVDFGWRTFLILENYGFIYKI